MNRPEPILVDAHRRPAVADAVAAGFADNEIWQWIVGSQWRLDRILPRYYRAMLRHVFMPLGTAFTTAGNEGGALWLPSDDLALSARQRLRETLSMVPWLGPAGLGRGAEWERLQRRHHPTEPHWYLHTLSIAPQHQRRGHGTTLLAPMLERCDREGLPAYLETQREANVPYYRRFGFELTDEVRSRHCPPVWLMWREPR